MYKLFQNYLFIQILTNLFFLFLYLIINHYFKGKLFGLFIIRRVEFKNNVKQDKKYFYYS